MSSIRRVVKAPERWPRIVELAAQLRRTAAGGAGRRRAERVPGAAQAGGSGALSGRVAGGAETDGARASMCWCGPATTPDGHFGLAAHDYTHSTAPNRRFADLVTQRLVKALWRGAAPTRDDELDAIARNCTLKEDAARKVERDMTKRIAAVALAPRVGQSFAAVVTGVTPKGVFVRIVRAAGGRPADARRAGSGCGRPDSRHAAQHGSAARLHRFREGVMDGTKVKCCATRWRRWRIAAARRCAARRRSSPSSGVGGNAHAGRDSGAYLRSVGLGAVAGRRGAEVAIPCRCELGCRRRRGSSPRWRRSTRGWRSDAPLGCPPEKLFQGPVADALTHVGQIAMLRRMAGVPVRGKIISSPRFPRAQWVPNRPLLG